MPKSILMKFIFHHNRSQTSLRSIFLSPKLIFSLISIGLVSVLQAQSSLVYLDGEKLSYTPFAVQGQSNAINSIPDFSHAGYKGGGVSLPNIEVKITVSPIEGDDRLNIQNAINQVSVLPLDQNGFRGAVLLTAGTYQVEGSLVINKSGVVLKGEGQGNNGTVIQATLTSQHDLITVTGSGSLYENSSTTQNITTSYVPIGSDSIEVANVSAFNVGDLISVKRTPNQAWIDELGMDQTTLCGSDLACNGWTSTGYAIKHERIIKEISGNYLKLNIPIVNVIEDQYGGGKVSKASWSSRINNCGVENLRIVSSYASNIDENHVWSAVKLSYTTNCWVKMVTSQYAGYSCVDLAHASFTTVEDCAFIDPKSILTGSRRYSFNIDKGIGNLFQRCYASEGRHDFVLGSQVTGPNVFLDCYAENTVEDIGPHHRWATGTLFDNIEGGQIRVWNRGASGSGHGWSGAQTMFWNCKSTRADFKINSPKGAINWGIGCSGVLKAGSGYWESWNQQVLPRSLYLQQLKDRLGEQAVLNITTEEQRNGTILNKLKKWRGIGGIIPSESVHRYVVHELNYTNGSELSEDGVDLGFFVHSSSTSDTDGDGQLRVDRVDGFMSPVSIPEISEGKLHVYVTLAGFNLDPNPANGGAYRHLGIRLQNSGTIIAGVRFKSDVRDLGAGEVPVIRLGGANNEANGVGTASSAGYPFPFTSSSSSLTYGFTMAYDGGDIGLGSWNYWIGSPDDDGSTWAEGPFSGASKSRATKFNAVNEIRFVIDHSGGTGDTPSASNFLNIDRILVIHESSVAPAATSLGAATKDNAVTISSNTATTASKRVQSLTVNSGSTLTVASGHELTVIDKLVVEGTLLIASGGSLKTLGTVTGEITKQRETTHGAADGQYSIVGSPVAGATTDALGGITYKYDESVAYGSGNQERFTQVTSTETMAPADGYFAANLGTASFTGTPNTGTVTTNLVYSAGEGSDAGWNCVANPFPGSIELKSLVISNPDVTGSIYLWDDGGSASGQRTNADYIAVSASGTATMGSGRSADFDGYIRSEQGFFVQATNAGTLTFDAVMKAGVNPNSAAGYFRKASNKELLRVSLSNEKSISDLVIELNAQATSGFDRFYDARRIKSGNELGLFSFTGEEQLAIQGLSDITDVIWLGLDIPSAGMYVLNFENSISDTPLYLTDHLTGEVIDLSTTASYSFTSASNTIAAKRFSIGRGSNILSVDDEMEELGYRWYFDDSELVILAREELENATISVHDIRGKLLIHATGVTTTSSEWRSTFTRNKGLYILNVYNNGERSSFKILKGSID
jgi:hypothetical protein